MTDVSFDISPEDSAHVSRIVARLSPMQKRNRISLRMDLVATHANGCPMDFARLADATDFDLHHDVFGIIEHIDRTTGKLEDHFRPRFALRTVDADPRDALIAELRAALRSIVDIGHDDYGPAAPARMCAIARAAIAKAEGRAS